MSDISDEVFRSEIQEMILEENQDEEEVKSQSDKKDQIFP